MTHFSLLLTGLILSSFVSIDTTQMEGIRFSEPFTTGMARNEEKVATPEDQKTERDQIIEEFEKEKLARMRRNVGRRFIVVKTPRPPEFYEEPDESSGRIRITKEKEGFLVMEVVRHSSEMMYFYKVRFDSGQVGYLSADAHYLEIKILEGSILPLSKQALLKKRSGGAPRTSPSKAVEFVKNHLTSDGKSVEARMREAKIKLFPDLKWRYEAKEIGKDRYRVIQYSEGEEKTSIFRTWIVDLSKGRVDPENLAAQKLYH